jgi:hypothetical protein
MADREAVMAYQKFSERPPHQTLGALGGLGGQHPQISKDRTTPIEGEGGFQNHTPTPPKAPKPPKVLALASTLAARSYAAALAALDRRCPDHIPPEHYWQCLDDARAFLQVWGDQAAAL